VSEDDLVEANQKLLAFLCEAIKESKIEKLKEQLFRPGLGRTDRVDYQALRIALILAGGLRRY
jgi:hypothetical protein